MNRSRLLILFALFIGTAAAGLLCLAVAAQARTTSNDDRWLQVNEDGFGSVQNGQIPSLAVFKGYLYAGTQNYTHHPESAEIWRTANGTDWIIVDNRLANSGAALQVYHDHLYCGSWSGKIWRSPNGTIWTDVVLDGFGDPANGIARFAVYSDTLYAGTWNGTTGTEIWRTTDGVNWKQFGKDGLDLDPTNGGAIASQEFDGYLYWGIGNWIKGAELWRTDGITLTPVITGGFGITANASVSALAVFGADLYASLWNPNGPQVWRTSNGADWVHVIDDDISGPGVKQHSSLEVYNGRLYLTLLNEDAGMEVWRSPNGSDWEQVGFEGLGDVNNGSTYWDNATVVFSDSLYLAARNVVSGGEIWRFYDPLRKIYLPGTWR